MASDRGNRADGKRPAETCLLFAKGSLVQHCKTSGIYSILETPDILRIENGNKPAYLYGNGSIQWVRPQSEMEDGRFVKFEIVAAISELRVGPVSE